MYAHWRRLLTLAILALPLAAACQGDRLVPTPPIDPAVLYWELALNHHAVTLSTTAPYDTLTVTATPRNPAGEVLTGLPSPLYRSTDPERVVVTAEGTLVAAGLTTNPIAVIATLTTDNLRHEDTVLVRVVDVATPPVLSSFSIDPVPPDSAKHATDANPFSGTLDYLLNRLVRATDAGGAPLATLSIGFDPLPGVQADIFGFPPAQVPITDLLVSFRSSDTTVAKIQSKSEGGVQVFTLSGRRPGTVQLYASTTLFGVTMADTIPFRIGYPVLVYGGFHQDSSTIRVGAGGLVFWDLFKQSITFADPMNVAAGITAASFLPAADLELCGWITIPCTEAGNIPWSTSFDYQGRVFPVPGTYEYKVSRDPPAGIVGVDDTISAKIVVIDERDPDAAVLTGTIR